ncbi:MAG: protein translocase subunit SecD [Candidatus Aquicultorales bacterium]
MVGKHKYAIALALVLMLVAGALSFIYPVNKSARLGLDLRGGASVMLRAVPSENQPVNEEAMRKAEMVVRTRIDALGVAEPEIQRQGSRNILVQMPGIDNQDQAVEILRKPAVLHFAIIKPEYKALLEKNPALDLNALNNKLQEEKKGEKIYGDVLMTGSDLASASATYGGTTNTEPIVQLGFTNQGKTKFGSITGANVGQYMAIILDGQLKTWPKITQAIPSGNAVINGVDSIDEAKDIALVLQTGQIPVKLVMDEVRQVGPTLGMEALRTGLIAGAVGLALIALYMIILYRGLGVVTVSALAIFGILYWGLIAVFGRYYQWNLTLPGIAGVIISIGVAADSSIIFYERVKDELKEGKTFRLAVDNGFKNAFKTMLDADFVTWLTAGALFFIGIGTVRGFALTLAMGLVVDLFIMYFFTRSVIGLIAQRWPKTTPKLLGLKEGVA